MSLTLTEQINKIQNLKNSKKKRIVKNRNVKNFFVEIIVLIALSFLLLFLENISSSETLSKITEIGAEVINSNHLFLAYIYTAASIICAAFYMSYISSLKKENEKELELSEIPLMLLIHILVSLISGMGVLSVVLMIYLCVIMSGFTPDNGLYFTLYLLPKVLFNFGIILMYSAIIYSIYESFKMKLFSKEKNIEINKINEFNKNIDNEIAIKKIDLIKDLNTVDKINLAEILFKESNLTDGTEIIKESKMKIIKTMKVKNWETVVKNELNKKINRELKSNIKLENV